MASALAIKHLTIRITGKVQGVYFRDSTKAVADQLKIKGLVKNEPDGSVYIEAEGAPFWLEQFLDWCAEGPENAIVEHVETIESETVRNYTDFVVKKS